MFGRGGHLHQNGNLMNSIYDIANEIDLYNIYNRTFPHNNWNNIENYKDENGYIIPSASEEVIVSEFSPLNNQERWLRFDPNESQMNKYVYTLPGLINESSIEGVIPTTGSSVKTNKKGIKTYIPIKGNKILSKEAKANVKPLGKNGINQNAKSIYLEDTSPMNNYVLATNPLAITNNTTSTQKNKIGTAASSDNNQTAPKGNSYSSLAPLRFAEAFGSAG